MTKEMQIEDIRKSALVMAVSELEEIRELVAGIAESARSEGQRRLIVHLWGRIDGCCLRLAPIAGVEIEPGEPPVAA